MVLGACKPVDVLPCFVHVQGVRETATMMGFLGHPSLRAVGCPSQGPGEVNGPHEWANPKPFEALRPSF